MTNFAVSRESGKPRLAIISTFDELCGIAGYTKALAPQLKNHFDITVFDLDQFLFRAEAKSVQRLADAEITRICKELRNFDAVNIQLEHGTLGRTKKAIFRRFTRLVDASPRVCVTFHTILQSKPFPWGDVASAVLKLRFDKIVGIYGNHVDNEMLSTKLYAHLRKRQASVIVHTRRDMRMLKYVHGIESIFDHPLAFYPKAVVDEVKRTTRREDFLRLGQLPEGTVVLGCFGFVSKYKGIDVALRALRLLPPNFHLAIFGGLHPNEIKQGVSIDAYVSNLLGQIEPGRKWLDVRQDEDAKVNLTLSAGDYEKLTLAKHPSDLSSRVHFVGALKDEDFPKAMEVCDVALLPYMEVGQSSSGPMSIAIEMGKPIVASRTKAFMQIERYHPDRLNLFEIGNFLELAQVVRAVAAREDVVHAQGKYDAESNTLVYKQAMGY
ncbi:Glycosyltransferase [Cupriavidus necator]|uniref:glycosyltransferase n=1 Tax=Cupriavidus necator TaxID=106590 RepID=UPI003F73176F